MCNKCKKNKCCDCVIVINRNPPPAPIPGIIYPPNTNTLTQVIDASCGLQSSQSRKRCSSVVTELFKLFNDLQYEYRLVNAEAISKFYAAGAVVSYNGTLLIGQAAILSGFIQPLLNGFTSVNPDFTTLLYQVVTCESAVQYGSFTISFYTGTTVTSTATYTVLTTLERSVDKCGRPCGWVIISQVISVIAV